MGIPSGRIIMGTGLALCLLGGAFVGSVPPAGAVGATASAVVVGGSHTCARLTTGKVECWGDNQYGELGNGTRTNSDRPVTVTGLSGVTAVATGSAYTCARLNTGTVKCWGDSQFGQLGDGTTTGPQECVFGVDTQVACSTVPVAVTRLSGVTAIAAGGDHTCARLSTGTVECWGENQSGQLGNGSSTDSDVPVAVTGLHGVTAITAGRADSCARLIIGTAKCWGENFSGELGNGTTTGPQLCSTHSVPCSTVPVTVPGLGGVASMANGGYHTCARLNTGTVKCWGDNQIGQLGNGTKTSSDVPVVVTDLTGVTAITAGVWHSCALLSSATVDCWGQNYYGQLGGSLAYYSLVPVVVTGLTGATAITAGAGHTCALLSTGKIECWGDNSSGQLGNGSTAISYHPVPVAGL